MYVKLTLLLVLANLLVFFFIYRLDRPHQSTIVSVQNENLFGAQMLIVDRLEIAGKALTEKRVLERQGDTWRIVSPFQWPANYYAVNRILTQLQFLEKEIIFSVKDIHKNQQTIGDYGLDDPNLVLSLHHGDSTTTLTIGDPTPIGNSLYALSPDQESILAISKDLIEGLSVDLHDLRSQNILAIPLYEIRSLTIQMEDLKIRLIREEPKWQFETPIQTDADSEKVAIALNGLIATHVDRFLEQPEIDTALQRLGNPAIRITLEGNNRRQTLLLSEPLATSDEPGFAEIRYARLEDRPTLFTVNAKPFAPLLKAQESLREKNFVWFDRESLNAIEITGTTPPPLTLQKLETGAWQVLAANPDTFPPAQPADEPTVQALIDGLLNLRAMAFTSDAPAESDLDRFGFTHPQRTIALKGPQEALTLISIGNANPENGLLYAKVGPFDVPSYIYEVSPHTLDLLSLSPLHYRTRTLARQPSTARVQTLKLTHLKDGVVLLDQTFDPEAQDWEEPLGAHETPQRKAALFTLLESLLSLEVKNYLQTTFIDAFQPTSAPREPWVYRIDATFYLPGADSTPQKTLTLFVTRRLGGDLQVGGSPDFEMTFSLQQKLIDALFVLTRPVQSNPRSEVRNSP